LLWLAVLALGVVAARPPAHAQPVEPACDPRGAQTAAPAERTLGEVTTVTLHLGSSCFDPSRRADVILALDRSGSMGGDNLLAAQAAATAFVQAADPATTHIGLVVFSTRSALWQGLTADKALLLGAIQAITASGATDMVAGLAEAALELQGPRRRPATAGAIVLMSDGANTGGPAAAIRAAEQVKAEGHRLLTIGFGSGADAATLAAMASSPADTFIAPTAAELVAIYRRISRVFAQALVWPSVAITSELAANMTHVPGGSPVPAANGATLTWSLADVTAAGITLTYRLRPQEAGTWPVARRTLGVATTTRGDRTAVVFLIPQVRVAAADAVPSPGAPPSGCLCPVVTRRVPAAVVHDVLAQPERALGWRVPLDPGKPPGPANPPRECLTLQHLSLDYHPLWNRPVWRVGCP
jgi:uncharacterized protein YegL